MSPPTNQLEGVTGRIDALICSFEAISEMACAAIKDSTTSAHIAALLEVCILQLSSEQEQIQSIAAELGPLMRPKAKGAT